MKQLVMSLLVCLQMPAFAAVPKKLTYFPEGDRLVYGRLVDLYRKNQLASAVQQRDLLAKNYPQSVHLDNAFYLTGMLNFQNNRWAEAVRDFGTVADKYPSSNKRPGALFALAMTYDKLGLRPQSDRVLNQLVKQYPGSVESQRAWMQLRLNKVNVRKK
jgi:TolA-binding protein